MGRLENKIVVLGVSGGISAYRSCELARLLCKEGASVPVVLTEDAARLVGPLTFQALTGQPVEVGQGCRLASTGMAHIDLGRQADCLVIAPATANTLAKMALGLADNLLTTTVLASNCPLVLAPAMNTRMWEQVPTQENIKRLHKMERVSIVGPGSGSLACGEEGAGRMEEPAVILEAVLDALTKKDLRGRKILVTAGPTREAWDPVRYLSNRSSGKMGYALAMVARRRGAEVVLISGPCSVPSPWGVQLVSVTSAADMARAVHHHAVKSHAVLMAAAVADYRPKHMADKKIQKSQSALRLELEPTEDILASLGKKKGKIKLIGFAAQTGDPVAAAQNKLKKKHLDLVVANDVAQSAAGFDVDTNLVHLVDQKGSQALPLLSKEEVACRILDRLVQMLGKPDAKPVRRR